MNNNTLLIVLAFLLGLFLSGIMKNLCGCQLVEGMPSQCFHAGKKEEEAGVIRCRDRELNEGKWEELQLEHCSNYEMLNNDETTFDPNNFENCVIPNPSQSDNLSLFYFDEDVSQHNITINNINKLVNKIIDILVNYKYMNGGNLLALENSDFVGLVNSLINDSTGASLRAPYINFSDKINIIKVYSKKMADEKDKLYQLSATRNDFKLNNDLSVILNEINGKILEAECFPPFGVSSVTRLPWTLNDNNSWSC
jgi:hypothetical protein